MASVLQKCTKFVSTMPRQVNLNLLPCQTFHHGIHFQYCPRTLLSHQFKTIKNIRFLSTSNPLLYSEAIITGVKATDTIAADNIAMDAGETEAIVNLTSHQEKRLSIESTQLGQIREPIARNQESRRTINTTDFKNLSEKVLSQSSITEREVIFVLNTSINKLNIPTIEKITIVKDLWRELGNHDNAKVTPPVRNLVLSFFIENDFDIDPKELIQELFSTCEHGPNIRTFKLMAVAYGKKGDLPKTVKMAELFIGTGGEMDETIYESLIQASCKSGDMDGAREVLTSMKKAFPNLEIASILSQYHHFINSYAELRDLKGIDDTLQEMEKYNISLPSAFYVQMLDHLLLGGNIELLDDVLAKLSAAGLTTRDLQSVVEKCLQRGQGDLAITLLLKSISPSQDKRVQQRLDFVHLLRRSTDPYQALDLFISYNTQLGVYQLTGIGYFFGAFVGDWQLASVLEHPYFVDNKLNGADFVTLCHRLAQYKNVTGLFNLYCILLAKGIKLSDSNFRPMLAYFGEPTSCEYSYFFDSAKNVPDLIITGPVTKEILSKIEDFTLEQLSNMLPSLDFKSVCVCKSNIQAKIVSEFDIGLATDIVSYFHENGDDGEHNFIGNVIEQLSIQKSDNENAFQLFKEVRGKGVPISADSYFSLLRFLQKVNDFTRCDIVARWMQEQNIAKNIQDPRIPGAIAKEFFSKLENHSLEQLLNILLILPIQAVFAYKSNILAKVVAEFDIALATDIVSYFHENGDTRVYEFIGKIIERLSTSQKIDHENAFELAKKAREKGIPISVHGYSCLLSFLYKTNDSTRFYNVVSWMNEQNVKLNINHLRIMLYMAGKCGNSMSAQYCYNQLRLSNVVLRNERTVYETLILAYFHDKTRGPSDHSEATMYYKEMLAKGLSPSEHIVRMFDNSKLKL